MVNTIKRTIQSRLEDKFFKGKVIILYGPRQVGKTTLVKEIQKKNLSDSIYFNCDEPDIREKLENKTSTFLKELIGDKKIIIIDEAQRIKNVGITLKLIIDNFKDVQVIATGSSSFDLANKTTESLTGRKYEFYLYPFSIEELNPEKNKIEIDRTIENRMIYGLYPEVIIKSAEAEENIKLIAKSYLYKDILQYQNIKNPNILEKLLQSLALQVGNEVSYNELSNFLDIDKKTVANYIEILKKAFVIFELKPFSRNLRNELRKLRKIYFFDNGVRNALINNFNSLDRRNDAGQLWENFIISERVKINSNHGNDYNMYFWRTHDKKEIDYLEEKNGKLYGYKIKLGSGRLSGVKLFLDTYPDSELKVIKKDNYNELIF